MPARVDCVKCGRRFTRSDNCKRHEDHSVCDRRRIRKTRKSASKPMSAASPALAEFQRNNDQDELLCSDSTTVLDAFETVDALRYTWSDAGTSFSGMPTSSTPSSAPSSGTRPSSLTSPDALSSTTPQSSRAALGFDMVDLSTVSFEDFCAAFETPSALVPSSATTAAPPVSVSYGDLWEELFGPDVPAATSPVLTSSLRC